MSGERLPSPANTWFHWWRWTPLASLAGRICEFMLNHKHKKQITGLLLGVLLLGVSCAAPKPTVPRRILTGTLGLPNEAFLKFAERTKPDLVIMGAFGAPQWTAQKDPRAWLAQWRAIFERMHRSDIKVVGMIALLHVGADVTAVDDWVEFYEKRWDEKLLGKKPSAEGRSLLEQRAWLPDKQRGAYAPRACAANPDWRAVEKALVGALIDAGIDGFITHRNMYGQCGCDHCHDGLRKQLAANYKADELKSQFGIANLAKHKLPHIYGFHRNHTNGPSALALEGMKFARGQTKACFDEVFLQYARGRKKNLIVAQWNHIPHFDEMRLVEVLQQHGVLVVPGRGFGLPGYFRISYCVDQAVLEGAAPGFAGAFRELGS